MECSFPPARDVKSDGVELTEHDISARASYKDDPLSPLPTPRPEQHTHHCCHLNFTTHSNSKCLPESWKPSGVRLQSYPQHRHLLICNSCLVPRPARRNLHRRRRHLPHHLQCGLHSRRRAPRRQHLHQRHLSHRDRVHSRHVQGRRGARDPSPHEPGRAQGRHGRQP